MSLAREHEGSVANMVYIETTSHWQFKHFNGTKQCTCSSVNRGVLILF